jgi:ABC-2 type transport system ATP-binding protein
VVLVVVALSVLAYAVVGVRRWTALLAPDVRLGRSSLPLALDVRGRRRGALTPPRPARRRHGSCDTAPDLTWSDVRDGGMPAIETTGLTKRYGDVLAVEDLSLTVERGEAFGFLGPNGAGKSTTIDALLGFQQPTAGEVRVLGEDATAAPVSVRERVGLLPDGYDVYENLTGREHVRSAIASKAADDDPDRLLDRVGLDAADARRPAGEYSKGMTQRLFLAVALVGEPELLVLDEPSTGLDPSGIRRLRRIVETEVDRGATVFFSSHDLDEVERVCDRVGIVADGELVAVDGVENLRAQLGVGAVVQATLDGDPGELSLGDVDGVEDVAVDGRLVRATCSRPAAKMRALSALDEAATVVDLTVEEPSLEEVFAEYTAGGPGGDADAPVEEPTGPAAPTGDAVLAGTGGD